MHPNTHLDIALAAAIAVSPGLTGPIARALDAAHAIPGAFPAVSATIVQGDAPPWVHVRGADEQALFYIASQTKSFMGLLGATLDRRGVLPLDTTLADVWPELVLPAPADPRRITMAALLSHQEGLTTDTLNFVTAYVRTIPASDYPRWLATEVRARDPGFRYSNLGDLVYAAALESHTGRDWRQWLDEAVLRPLELEQGVLSRSSLAPASAFAWNHQWDGMQWRAFPPKPDALMHPAGGLFASAQAMGTWMRANLGTGEAGSALPRTDFTRAQEPVAAARLADGEIDCNGYSLGWYSCTYKGQHALMHPGSYVGTVSVTVLVPTVDAGLSLVVNSDTAMEGFELEVMKAFIGLATGQEGEQARLDAAVTALPSRIAATVHERQAAMEEERADAAWSGWNWKPSASELQACTGRFRDELFGTLELRMHGTGLAATIGERSLVLEPARQGLFAASDGTVDTPEPLACDPSARVLHWRGRSFRKP
ncbi:MAG: beta-lactamase family protein [Pseudomonadota bacterium]|nr:beta-lactamase family protein [Pseudomonadota bacterium]